MGSRRNNTRGRNTRNTPIDQRYAGAYNDQQNFDFKAQKQPTPPKLKALIRDLLDVEKRLIFVDGLPSTGKTKCSIEAGLKCLRSYKYEKLVIIRPVIQPEFGLLPGTLGEKMAPYVRQSAAYVDEAVQAGFGDLVEQGRIEILPADLLQGNRFRHSFVVLDEMQNIPKDKTFAILSRVGEGCKYVIIGDTSRGQQNSKVKTGSMLHYCVEKFADKPWAAVHTFYEESDILGDDITKQIIIELIPDFVL